MKSNSNSSPMISTAQRKQFIEDGYVVVSGLIPDEVVTAARNVLWQAIDSDPNDPLTWRPEDSRKAYAYHQEMAICRTSAIEDAAEELVGPNFLRGVGYSPVLENKGENPIFNGYIPVLNFPTPGPKEWTPPQAFHIDGLHTSTLWPQKLFLIVLTYLSDTVVYGGATTIRPGSHRQIFTYWIESGEAPTGDTALLPDITFRDPIPLPGRAGDVIFMHYLLAHAGSRNHSEQIRFALNTNILPDPNKPYQPRIGAPQTDWTPLDETLRTDDLKP
jgi:hypothetical protein